MNTWAPIWSPVVDSTLWEESGDVIKVFFTMLATKDSDHVCRMDAYRIHRKCNLDEVYVLEILKLLASPDKRRKSQQEFEGRRIKAVEDGWLILNGEKYREKVTDEMRKARLRRAQDAFRKRKRMAKEAAAVQMTPEREEESERLHGVVVDAVKKLDQFQDEGGV